jgi:DNA primase
VAFYSEEIIQQLKSHADIADVIQQFVPLKRSGNRYLGRCPFHDDRSPSMNVNPQLGIYKCFACGAGGDVFKFIMEHEKLDFKSAVEWVAGATGFSLPSLNPSENKEVTEERGLIKSINELAASWFERELTKNDFALQYLRKRGITEETQKKFRIGYAPNSRSDFISFASQHGFSPKDLVKAGLAIERETGGITDKFRGRLMFTIQNLTGMVVAFGGRILEDRPNTPKYMNSPETALYSKSQILYGLNHSKQEISKKESVILVEGYFDLISLYQAGIQNVVAVSGTALTETHANILSRYAKTAYLVFDSDAAGKKATLRSLEIVLPHNITPRIFSLSRPNGEKIDPDNFIRENGAEAFLKELGKAEDWLTYLGKEKPTETIEERAAFIHEIKSIIAKIQDKELRDQYLKMLSERYQTRATLPTPAPAYGKSKKNVLTPQAPQVEWNLIPSAEFRFVALILKNESLWKPAASFFNLELAASGISFLESTHLGELLELALAFFQENQTIDLKRLHPMLSPALQEILENLPSEEWSPETATKEFLEALLVLLNRSIDRFRKEIKTGESEKSFKLRLDLLQLEKENQKELQMLRGETAKHQKLFQKILETRDKLIAISA